MVETNEIRDNRVARLRLGRARRTELEEIDNQIDTKLAQNQNKDKIMGE